ncbi:hypothetical protein Poly30_18680 [Planctomycetes bacterium Poly30]|uniref:Uncharacterized protein n=1 Tax=Saltatorellus ferox TaxID=2528018 RepID=A0A518EQJ8_9BACT|nr:hypothetical protein Poly30_18680 [Planctomycetes bacterium Poly30]
MRVLSTLGAAACGAFILSGLASAQNSDECSTATPVAGLGTFAMDTTAATNSGSSPCGGIGQDVWFAWTASATESVQFSTCGGAGWDTALAIYGGTCGSLTLLDCNDDDCGLQSRVQISAMAGQTYFLRAGAYNGQSGGTGTFTVAQAGSGSGGCTNPSTGPDVIVGDINGASTFGTVGNMSAYSLGTTSCNVGDQELLWIAGNNQHPVIGQNIFRMEDGRFEQIGLGWLKHGFTALQQNLCCDCNNSGTGTRLGVGCSDPYGSGLNGSQSGLGPRSQVNAFTGAFSYPFLFQGQTGDAIYKRIQVLTDDVNPSMHPTARYFGEAQYVTPDDSAAGHGANSISYCDLNRSNSTTGGAYRLNTVNGSTVRELCAIRGWEAADSGVVAEDIQVPGEGLFVAGSNAIDNNDGTWTYNYAVCNINSDFSGRQFTVPFGMNVTVSDVGMSFPMYHSGEPYTNIAWTGTINAGNVSWETEGFMQNANANALRWGTTYSFWFTANAAPQTVTASLGLFKPGNPGDQNVALIGPGDGNGSSVVINNYCMANSNSTGQPTAIVASNVDLMARTMQLDSLNMPQNAFGFFITSLSQGFVANPGGSSGNLCVAGNIGRGVGGGVLSSGTAGSFTGIVDLDMIPTPTGTTSVMAGETRYFQSWHRDAILGIATSNFSDGVRVQFP